MNRRSRRIILALLLPAGAICTAAQAQNLNVSVVPKCEGKDVTFAIKNNGGDWPKGARLRVYDNPYGRAGVGAEPRAQLKAGETYTVKTDAQGKGEQGLFIMPDWYSRGFSGHDSKIDCKTPYAPGKEPLKVTATGSCEGTKGTFAIKNDGETWVNDVTLRFAGKGGNASLGEQKAKLAKGETKSFSYEGKGNGELVVSALPSWYDSGGGYLAKVTCDKPLPPINVSVKASCEGTTAVFAITNNGDSWPGPIRLRVYAKKGDAVSAEPRVKIDKGQTYQLKVQAKDRGEQGLFIMPDWYSRGFSGHDSKIECK
jgi:hypothetical protein